MTYDTFTKLHDTLDQLTCNINPICSCVNSDYNRASRFFFEVRFNIKVAFSGWDGEEKFRIKSWNIWTLHKAPPFLSFHNYHSILRCISIIICCVRYSLLYLGVVCGAHHLHFVSAETCRKVWKSETHWWYCLSISKFDLFEAMSLRRSSHCSRGFPNLITNIAFRQVWRAYLNRPLKTSDDTSCSRQG